MSIESAIEKMIQQAIERGDFENLEGRGKPLDLNAYFNTPEDVRMGYSVLKSNNFVPEEIELLKEIAGLKEKMSQTANEAERKAINKILIEKNLSLALTLEKRRKKRV